MCGKRELVAGIATAGVVIVIIGGATVIGGITATGGITTGGVVERDFGVIDFVMIDQIVCAFVHEQLGHGSNDQRQYHRGWDDEEDIRQWGNIVVFVD